MSIRLTRQGKIMVGVLCAMLLGAINYDNNLVYFILFLLLGVMLVSAFHAYQNLVTLEAKVSRVGVGFAGGALRMCIALENQSRRAAYQIKLRYQGKEFEGPDSEVSTLPARKSRLCEVLMKAKKRGEYVLESIELQSDFPLGWVSIHKAFSIGTPYWVYPRPGGDLPWPEVIEDPWTQDDGQLPGGDDFYGLREYQKGESQRRVDWKAVARGRPLMVKEFVGGGTGRLWFDERMLPQLTLEPCISQLAQWVQEADQQGVHYGLRLKSRQIDPGSGPAHYHACMRALAER